MNDDQMGAVKSRFADLIWANEPISSTELARRSVGLLPEEESAEERQQEYQTYIAFIRAMLFGE